MCGCPAEGAGKKWSRESNPRAEHCNPRLAMDFGTAGSGGGAQCGAVDASDLHPTVRHALAWLAQSGATQ